MKLIGIISTIVMTGLLAGCVFRPTPLPANHPANPSAAESASPRVQPVLVTQPQTNTPAPTQIPESSGHDHVHHAHDREATP